MIGGSLIATHHDHMAVLIGCFGRKRGLMKISALIDELVGIGQVDLDADFSHVAGPSERRDDPSRRETVACWFSGYANNY